MSGKGKAMDWKKEESADGPRRWWFRAKSRAKRDWDDVWTAIMLGVLGIIIIGLMRVVLVACYVGARLLLRLL